MKPQELDETLLRTLIEFNKAKEKAYKELKAEGITKEDVMRALEDYREG